MCNNFVMKVNRDFLEINHLKYIKKIYLINLQRYILKGKYGILMPEF